MIQKIKSKIILLGGFIVISVPLVVPAVAFADNIQNGLCTGAQSQTLSGVTACPTGQGTNFDTTLTTIINLFSIIVGVVAVIMIIAGGFRYVTSGGKEEGVKGAKNTILYALIGLVIVALAQLIVKFVLNKAISPGS